MNKLLTAVALTTALLAGSAQAAALSTVNLTGSTGGTLSAGISHTLSGAGSFEDTYLLDGYSGQSLVNGTLSTLILKATGPDIDISSVTLNGVSFSQHLTPYLGNPDGRELYALPATSFSGQLTLVVKGVLVAGRDGNSVGTYSANFRVTPAAPVPEPQTYALFASGVMVVGFLASRRRRV
jgi:hypothetical protein